MSEDDELLFVPLGGAGEIGMNLNLYGFGPPGAHRWMMIDLGITFGDGSLPGVDVLMPDPAFIEDKLDQLEGLVLTHAHEDHLGAVPYLWDRLRCPVYATPFTASILRGKLADVDLLDDVPLTEIGLGGRFSVGPFDLELITLTHSIPEPNGIAIRTPLGTVLHTGDWKFDPDPVIGEVSDEKALRQLGDDGVLAIVCDSTNVFTPGTSGSEGDLLESLTKVIADCKGRVAVTCFASNVARLETVARAAMATDRSVVLAGRSLWRFDKAARDNGLLADIPPFLDPRDAGYLPKENTLIICTGSQGEPRAALARIAWGDHPQVDLEAGDTVIFSSRQIPGNEMSIGRVQNQLIRRDIRLVTDHEAFVHVSGHPARDELVRMYQHVKPKIAVPVHGELRHMAEHAHLAATCQVAETVVNENGGVVRLAPGPAEVIDHVPSGRMVLEGSRVVHLSSELVRGRSRAVLNGKAVVTVVVDPRGDLLAEPLISTVGLLDEDDDDVHDAVLDAVEDTLDGASKRVRKDDEALNEALRIAVRRVFRYTFDKRPVTKIHLVRVDDPE